MRAALLLTFSALLGTSLALPGPPQKHNQSSRPIQVDHESKPIQVEIVEHPQQVQLGIGQQVNQPEVELEIVQKRPEYNPIELSVVKQPVAQVVEIEMKGQAEKQIELDVVEIQTPRPIQVNLVKPAHQHIEVDITKHAPHHMEVEIVNPAPHYVEVENVKPQLTHQHFNAELVNHARQ